MDVTDEAVYGMSTPAGEEAVRTLVETVVSEAEVDVDFALVARRLNEGVSLIASYHPEVYDPLVVLKIEDAVSQGIADQVLNSRR